MPLLAHFIILIIPMHLGLELGVLGVARKLVKILVHLWRQKEI
jgi:hypothetical protein